jgi:hypothetical protein
MLPVLKKKLKKENESSSFPNRLLELITALRFEGLFFGRDLPTYGKLG